jgi:hypothetical protein
MHGFFLSRSSHGLQPGRLTFNVAFNGFERICVFVPIDGQIRKQALVDSHFHRIDLFWRIQAQNHASHFGDAARQFPVSVFAKGKNRGAAIPGASIYYLFGNRQGIAKPGFAPNQSKQGLFVNDE